MATAIFTITFVGWNILYLISGRSAELYFLEKLSLAFGMGIGFLSLEMLILHFMNLRFSLGRILIPWAALLTVNLILYFKYGIERSAGPAGTQKEGVSILRCFLIFGIAIEIIYAFFRALIKPMEAYDAIAIYAIKAKIFYLADSIPQDFFSNLGRIFPHLDYPLNIPLSETLTYIFLGNLNDQLVKVIFPLFFVGALVILYYAIRRFASRTYALVFTFLLASIPQFNAYAANGYLDLPLGYYYTASAVFLFLWFKDTADTGFLIISSVMAALGAWTKNEGLMYCLINLSMIALFFIFNRKKTTVKKACFDLFIYAFLILIISSPWLYAKASERLANDEIGLANMNPINVIRQWQKIGTIAYEFQKEAFGPKKWNMIWIATLVVIAFRHKDMFKGARKYITGSLSLAVAGYTLMYLISRLEIGYAVSKTWSRFMIHFLPVVIFWLAALLKEDIDI